MMLKSKITIKEMEKEREANRKSNREFIDFYVDYLKKTPNKKWSKQQNLLINSVMKSANQDARLYLKLKKLTAKQEY